MISKVVSVCCYRDHVTWQVASGYIVKNIAAACYEVVVPDHEVLLFSKITPAPYSVIGESHYLKERNLSWLKAQFPANAAFRAGWYLQQFIKIEAARQGRDDDVVLIWDADTVPLKPLNFVTPEKQIVYYKGEEFHPAYFVLIKKLLGLDKIVDFSFIAQCFALKVAWVNEFCREIEEKFRMHWIDAVLMNLDYADGCGFSEYESIGTYLTHRHLEDMRINNTPWERMGNSLIGNISHLEDQKAALLIGDYDFMSFESWDQGKFIDEIPQAAETPVKVAAVRKIPPINLVLLKRFQTLEPSFFDDAVHSVEYALKQAGFETYVSCNVVDPAALNIIWGAHAHFSPPLEQILEIAKPEFSVIFNMEQIAIGNSFVSDEYLSFLAQYRVLDYNVRNIQAMQAHNPRIRASEFPLLPSPQFAADFQIDDSREKSDVVFWGAPSDRRFNTLNALIARGHSARYITNAYGHYLSQEIYDSKICLNIHALQTGIFEIARCLRPLAMGMPVVSEVSHLPELVDWSQSGIYFCEYDQLVDCCQNLLDHPQLVNQAVRKTQHFVHNKAWIEITRNVILDLLKAG